MIAQVTRQKWPPVMIFVLPKVWQKCTVQSEMTFTIRQDGTPADDVTGMPSVRKVIVLTFLISAAHLMHCSGLTHNLLQSKAGTPWRRAIWNMKVFIYLHVLSGSTLSASLAGFLLYQYVYHWHHLLLLSLWFLPFFLLHVKIFVIWFEQSVILIHLFIIVKTKDRGSTEEGWKERTTDRRQLQTEVKRERDKQGRQTETVKDRQVHNGTAL